MRGGHEVGGRDPNEFRDIFGFILRSHQCVRPATKGRALSMLPPSAEGGEEARADAGELYTLHWKVY